jgi:hypothetical protein
MIPELNIFFTRFCLQLGKLYGYKTLILFYFFHTCNYISLHALIFYKLELIEDSISETTT